MATIQRHAEDYSIAWICALDLELTAARGMLDKEHDELPIGNQDSNTYTLGQIGPHNIVIASLPQGTIGTSAAAICASNLLRSFPKVRFGLLVGVGGAAPSDLNQDPRENIQLGDVVVSTPADGYGESSATMILSLNPDRWRNPIRLGYPYGQ